MESELSYKIGVGNYLCPYNNCRPLNFSINAVVLIVITKMVKCLPEFEYFILYGQWHY